jgi:hypothetical protein
LRWCCCCSVCLFAVRNDPTLLPVHLNPAILAAGPTCSLWQALFRSGRRGSGLLSAALALALVVPPAIASVQNGRRLGPKDPRELARLWIERNVSAGAHVATESYAPFVDGQRYQLQSFNRMTEHPPDWYSEQRFDVLVFTKGMYGRLYADRSRYAGKVADYDRMLARFPKGARLGGGDHEVRIHRTR